MNSQGHELAARSVPPIDGLALSGPVAERLDARVADDLAARERPLGPGVVFWGRFPVATRLFTEMARREDLDDFLTLPACGLLSWQHRRIHSATS